MNIVIEVQYDCQLLSTTVNNIQAIHNENNRILVNEFYEFMKSSSTSDKY